MTERTTDDLIAMLAKDTKAIGASAAGQRLALGLCVGAALTLLWVARMGWRHDLATAAGGLNFWVKLGYTALLAVIAVHWLRRLGRPESAQPRFVWLLMPMAALGLIAVIQLSQASPGTMPQMIYGRSWHICSRNIIMLALPIYLATLWVMRQFAPTRLTMAGAASGLVSGAMAATLYCLHCPETSMLFVLIWYSLGMAAATVVGALLGPHVLRW